MIESGTERLQTFLREKLGLNPNACEGRILSEGTNRSYYIRSPRGELVVRLGSPNAALLSVNRKAEEAALRLLSRHGISPQILYYSAKTGDMVTRYIPSREGTFDDLESPELLEKFIGALKSLHRLRTPYKIDPVQDIRRKLSEIRSHHIPVHAGLPLVLRHFEAVAARCAIDEKSPYYGLCHGDPWPNNFLVTPDRRVLLIDYEFAGCGDVFFDLSCLAGRWKGEKLERFLRGYFGRSDEELVQKMDDWEFVNTLWNGTWAYLKSLETNTTGVDYRKSGDGCIAFIMEFHGLE